ncbi:hypothetical protein EFW58_01713 [Bacillus velezensis]|nr:hypothetical protein EFW58_01713 [Bacillus velezensis]
MGEISLTSKACFEDVKKPESLIQALLDIVLFMFTEFCKGSCF